ncbi:MAG TPA: TadE family protein [Acidimicrobiales bacterium]
MSPSPTPPSDGDTGVGLIGSVAGLLVFLALMLFATQTLIALHTRTVVTDAAYEGARAVAGARVDHRDPAAIAAAQAAAEERIRNLLGRLGERADIDWSGTTPDTIRLRVSATPPSFLWEALRGPGHALVERTVTIRVEDFA